MPFRGTDRDAYKKAAKGKTPEERSKIYYQEKAKNEKILNQTKRFQKIQSIDSFVKPKSLSNDLYYSPRTKYKQNPLSTRTVSTTHKNSCQTQQKKNVKQQLKKSSSVIWDKTLNSLSDAVKDKIVDLTLELIKENTNEQIEKIIDTYQTVEKYIKVAQKIYKIIVEIDKKLNKLSIKYEQQPNDEFSQLKYKSEYERHKTTYSKYEDLSKLVIIDLQNLEIWHLGKNKRQANKIFKLVLNGKKVATSYLYNENDKLTNGEYSILTNWDEKKQILIQTTNIDVIPFNKVTKQHAHNEGEGTKTLRYWRKVHKEMFAEELAEKQRSFSEEILIVCETFHVVKILK